MLWSAGESCVKHLKTLGNIKTISATNCSCSYVKYMVNGGNLWLLNNVSPGFHISGVCSDICSFNRILRQFWILHTRFDGDVINSAVNSTTLFIVSPSTVYNGVTVLLILILMNSTVTSVESFRSLGTTTSQDPKWDNHIESIVEKSQIRGCTSFTSWGGSTCHRSCWYSSTLPSLNPSSAHQ